MRADLVPLTTTMVDKAIGQAVANVRIQRGIEQPICAALIGASVSEFVEQEKGLRRISADRLFRLAELFKVPLSSFFRGLKS